MYALWRFQWRMFAKLHKRDIFYVTTEQEITTNFQASWFKNNHGFTRFLCTFPPMISPSHSQENFYHYLCLSVCVSAALQRNGWMGLHGILRIMQMSGFSLKRNMFISFLLYWLVSYMTYMSYTFICICFSWGTQPVTRCLHIETAPRFRWIYWKIILTQLCRCNCTLIYAFPKRIYVIFSQNKSPLLMKALNSVTFSSLVNSLFHAPCLVYRRDQLSGA